MAHPHLTGKDANRYRKVYPAKRVNAIAFQDLNPSSSDAAGYTNLGLTKYLSSSHSSAASGTWDPRGFFVTASAEVSGGYNQFRLHSSQSFTLDFCSGAMFVADIKDGYGNTESSGFGQGHIFHKIIQLASASSVPPGVAIGIGLLNSHPSSSTPTGLFAGIRNDVTGGHGNKVFVQRVLAGVYSAPTVCSADVSEIRQMLSHVAPVTTTQYTAFSAVGLTMTSSVPGIIGTSIASDDATTAVWSGLNTVIYGGYYHGPAMGTAVTASVTASFATFIQQVGDMFGSNF